MIERRLHRRFVEGDESSLQERLAARRTGRTKVAVRSEVLAMLSGWE